MALSDFIDLFEWRGHRAKAEDARLLFGQHSVEIRDGIPRFTPDLSYSTGNFSLLRQKHASLQLDSQNGTTDRRDTILSRTEWPAEFFKGKLVLECGCGAGPDTEILRSLGAKVVSVDIAGVDICQANIGGLGEGCVVQADITNLPFRRGVFDIVFCHRVLQHTPNSTNTLQHILEFVRPDGAVFVHSYARTWQQMLRWKYALRPITKRIDSETLYNAINGMGPFLFAFTNWLYRFPGGRTLTHYFIPFVNYAGLPKLKGMTKEELLEYAVHDTFDALSPKYDNPISARKMNQIATARLACPFEVIEKPTITLLRSICRESSKADRVKAQ